MNRQNHFEPFRITFSSERTAHAIYLDQGESLSKCLEQLSLDCVRPTLLLIGGAVSFVSKVVNDWAGGIRICEAIKDYCEWPCCQNI